MASERQSSRAAERVRDRVAERVRDRAAKGKRQSSGVAEKVRDKLAERVRDIEQLRESVREKERKRVVQVLGRAFSCFGLVFKYQPVQPIFASTTGIFPGTKHGGQPYQIASRYGMVLTTLICIGHKSQEDV